MAKYEYSDTNGALQTIEADSDTTALSSAPNIATNSGVRLMTDALPGVSTPEVIDSGVKNPPYVSSSTPVINAEKNVTSMVSGLNNPNLGEQSALKASQSYTKELDRQIAELDRQNISQVKGVNAQYDLAEKDLKAGQEQEAGSYRTTLARIGGYLGDSASGTGTLLKLAQSHRNEVVALATKRAAAIQAANDAISEKKYKLALSKAQEAKDLEKEINTRRNEYLDNTIKAREEDRATFEGETKRADAYAPSIVDSIGDMDDAQAEEFINTTSKRTGIDPQILSSAVSKHKQEKNKAIQTTILNMVQDYPSAGISIEDINSGDLGLILDKVTASPDYIRKSAYEQAQTDKMLAEIVASSSGPESDVIEAFAETWVDTGNKPTSMPKGAEGVIYQTAKEIAKGLPDGVLVSNLSGFKATLPAEQAKAYEASWSILQQISYMRTLVENTEGQSPVGAGGKFNKGINTFLGTLPEDLKTFENVMDNVSGQLLLARSGQAVSEQEYQRVRGLLPSVGKWQKYNKTDLDAFEKTFRDALNTSLKAKNIKMKGFSDMSDGEIESEFDSLDEKKNDGGVSSLRSSIIEQESGGSYGAVGIDTAYGKALGKYQMIPKFHFARVGLNPNSEADKKRFLETPELQDRAFNSYMSELETEYKGDPRKVAAAYYGGKGAVAKLGTPAANVRFQGGKSPSINEYVRSVTSRLT